MKQLKSFFLLILMTVGSCQIQAQTPLTEQILPATANQSTLTIQWYDLQKQSAPVIHGLGWSEGLNGIYRRLPDRAEKTVRQDVWGLSHHCAGLSVRFITAAPEITVRYQISGMVSLPHMPSTGVSGVDLYRVGTNGKLDWCRAVWDYKDTIRFTYTNLKSADSLMGDREYQLFLPLYSHPKWMEIGIPQAYSLKWITGEKSLPIVVYGTSIAQGGCASRAGMAWTNIVERKLSRSLINLAFSGNGRLEPELIDLINEIPASLYILDCLPNLTRQPQAKIEELTYNAIKQIRQKWATPILLVEHAGYTDGEVDRTRLLQYQQANEASQKAFKRLKREGVRGLYYLPRKAIRIPADGMVDGTHPTDLGMAAYAEAYAKIIRRILPNH